MVESVVPLARILGAVRVSSDALPLFLVILKVPFVLLTAGEGKHAQPLRHALLTVPQEAVTVTLAEATEAMVLALVKLSLVDVAVRRRQVSHPRHGSLLPLALIELTVGIDQCAPPVARAVSELAHVLFPGHRAENPETVAAPSPPITDEGVPVHVGEHAVAVVVDRAVPGVLVVVLLPVQHRPRGVVLRRSTVVTRVKFANDLERRGPHVGMVVGTVLASRTVHPGA